MQFGNNMHIISKLHSNRTITYHMALVRLKQGFAMLVYILVVSEKVRMSFSEVFHRDPCRTESKISEFV